MNNSGWGKEEEEEKNLKKKKSAWEVSQKKQTFILCMYLIFNKYLLNGTGLGMCSVQNGRAEA